MPSKKIETPEDEVEETTAADEPTEAAPEPEQSNVRPTRVETYSVGDEWGYRLVDETGAIERESGLGYESEDAALRTARNDETARDLSFPSVLDRPRAAWQ